MVCAVSEQRGPWLRPTAAVRNFRVMHGTESFAIRQE